MGRTYTAPEPWPVTEASVRAFAAAVGQSAAEGSVPPTYPAIAGHRALMVFLDEAGLALQQIVHGAQHFAYERAVRVGDELTATLTVTGVRRVSGNDVVSTTTALTDASAALVCAASATVVRRESA